MTAFLHPADIGGAAYLAPAEAPPALVSADLTLTYVVDPTLVSADFVLTYAVDPAPLVFADLSFNYEIEVMPLVSADLFLSYQIFTEAPMDFTPSAVRTIKIRPADGTFEGGPFWDLTDPTEPIGRKDPDSVIDITFDWIEVLADAGDTLGTVVFELTGVTQSGSMVKDGKVSILLAGGDRELVVITCRIFMAGSPRSEDRTVYLKIGEE